MAKDKTSTALLPSILSAGLYKRNQGRLVRQVTLAAICLVLLMGCYSLAQGPLDGMEPAVEFGIPFVVFALGTWAAFRSVHYPRFADFLISVQGELDKVSWPKKNELYRSTLVVVATMFFLGALLLFFDVGWTAIMQTLDVLQV